MSGGGPDVGAKYIGAEVKRREDPQLLTGRGRYVDDLRPTGCLHAAILRSPHAHARIRRIQLDRARRRALEDHHRWRSRRRSRDHVWIEPAGWGGSFGGMGQRGGGFGGGGFGGGGFGTGGGSFGGGGASGNW